MEEAKEDGWITADVLRATSCIQLARTKPNFSFKQALVLI
jgi:hypothetical protein